QDADLLDIAREAQIVVEAVGDQRRRNTALAEIGRRGWRRRPRAQLTKGPVRWNHRGAAGLDQKAPQLRILRVGMHLDLVMMLSFRLMRAGVPSTPCARTSTQLGGAACQRRR